MKRSLLVVVLALALIFAFAASASATTGKYFKGGVDYYTWLSPSHIATTNPNFYLKEGNPVGTVWVASGVSAVGSNTVAPGAHANYLATTAKCGMCHSVHRAAGDGVKLLPTGDPSCAGCHTGGTAITAKVITWGVYNPSWRLGAGLPEFSYGGAGPHNDTLVTLNGDGEWDGISDPVPPSYATYPDFARYGCATRRCHATNPHGANSSKYTLFAAKLLFNNTVEQDDEEYDAERGNAVGTSHGTYGGDDAVWDAFGATDAAVERFTLNNQSVVQTTAAGEILIKKAGDADFRAPDAAETHALVSGLTCGRPSNPSTGEDECHAEASYAIVDKAIKENRNHATGLTRAPSGTPGRTAIYTTDNVGTEALGWGGNDNRDSKTGHVAGSFAAVTDAGSYVAVAGCTSCHDQTDSANTVVGNFTFPHGQTPVGTTNATAVDGTTGTMVRSRIWSGWGGDMTATKKVTDATTKAYDGQCLKCHRDGAGNGIGLTK